MENTEYQLVELRADANVEYILNHGHCRLVDMTPNADLAIVRNARVSYAAQWRTGADDGKDEKLINYLLKNGHTSPFEAVSITFDVKAPIFVLRQWHRHRTWSYNEVSARYTELPDECYIPELEHITTQSAGNKQMRTEEQNKDAVVIQQCIKQQCTNAHMLYRHMLSLGCPRELARGILPVNTYSHMFATVNLHNLFRFLKLRIHAHAQYEIRVYAEAMLNLIEPHAPIAVAAFYEHILRTES